MLFGVALVHDQYQVFTWIYIITKEPYVLWKGQLSIGPIIVSKSVTILIHVFMFDMCNLNFTIRLIYSLDYMTKWTTSILLSLILFVFESSYIPSTPAYGVYVSQLSHCFRVCLYHEDFCQLSQVINNKTSQATISAVSLEIIFQKMLWSSS